MHLLLLLAAALGGPPLTSSEIPVFELSVNGAATIPSPPASQVVVLDEHICTASVDSGVVRLVGVSRGETIVLVWVDGQADDRPTTVLVRVSAPTPEPVEKQLTPEERDAIGHGFVGTTGTVGSASSGARSVSLLTPFSWSQGTDRGRLTTIGQTQRRGDSGVALDTLTARWSRDQFSAAFFDFNVDLDGGVANNIVQSTPINSFALRGADVALTRGVDRFEMFAGEAFPWSEASRQLVGLTVRHQATHRRLIDTATGAVRAPDTDLSGQRKTSMFQTVGLTERINERTSMQARVGIGHGGTFGQGSATWQSDRTSAFATVTATSPQFGPNQLQLVYAPSRVARGGASWKPIAALTAAVGYDHTVASATPLVPDRSSADYTTASTALGLTRAHTLFASGVWNRTVHGFGLTRQTTGRRLNSGLSSQFGRAIANTFQLSAGALVDPLQVDSRADFSVRNHTSVTVKGGTFNVSISHDRLDRSLVSRLRQRLDLLAPDLQSLFSDDPIAFVHSGLMPADVRRLIESLEPVDTAVAVSGQFRAGSTVTVAPTFSYLHTAQSRAVKSWSEMFGYALTWRASRTLELQSSLTHSLVVDPHLGGLARTTVFGIGLRKELNGLPGWSAGPAGRHIRGRVFRDTNLDGAAQPDEVGLDGILVRLSNGVTTRTDAQGRFDFHGLKPGEYRVVVPLAQFGAGTRVTTAVDRVTRLYEQRDANIDFGVVHFSRIVGRVFNDVAMDGVRRTDAPGIRDVAVLLTSADIERRVMTDDGGDFEIDDLVPGNYQVTVDPQTVPANFLAPSAPAAVHVMPSATAVVSLAVQALRSVSGQVLIRHTTPTSSTDPAAARRVPLKRVRVAVGNRTVLTDDDGRFLMRDVPAGELNIGLIPIKPLPDDLRAPNGTITLPADPVQMNDVTIVIENPRLIECLTTAFEGSL